MNCHVYLYLINVFWGLALAKNLPADLTGDNLEALHDAQHKALKNHHQQQQQQQNRNRRSLAASDNSLQCAVMYKNDRPVGILQPYQDSYQLLPVHEGESVPVDISPLERIVDKRSADDKGGGGDATEEKRSFSDEKYPYIFAKFKIDSKVEKDVGEKSRNVQKREMVSDEHHKDSLSSTLSRIETRGADAELKGILNDMGLIDDEERIDKRDADLIEDEDLEHGTNKINLIKIETSNEEDRPKRRAGQAVTQHYGELSLPEPKSINEEEYINQYINKHPEQFKDDAEQPKKSVREARSEVDDVSAQMEKQIKERLQKIKEEVRNEIEKIKASDSEETEEEGVDEEDEEKMLRRKRYAMNTLEDGETGEVDPLMSADNDLVPHVRRRRSLEETSGGFATTVSPRFLTRALKLYKTYDDDLYEDDTALQRDKKDVCKCQGKGCKCPQSLTGIDGSNLVYFDGAIVPVQEPFQGIVKDTGMASMNIRPVKKRPSRHDEETPTKYSESLTSILKGLKNGGYTLDLDPDIYKITARSKRNSFFDLVALNGGGPVLDHLLAIREQSMMAPPKIRNKRTTNRQQQEQQRLTLTDMSGEDLFGALPQGFEGGSARFKRVKRA